jgi:hypothetical protein
VEGSGSTIPNRQYATQTSHRLRDAGVRGEPRENLAGSWAGRGQRPGSADRGSLPRAFGLQVTAQFPRGLGTPLPHASTTKALAHQR